MSYVFKAGLQGEGVGVKVMRVIGGQYLKNLDPFVMLDYARFRLPAGFNEHPHRGFQAIGYIKQGRIYHQDFKGHKGIINGGDVQWMSAGKGIMHCQLPGSFQQDTVGFQLWLNLRAQDKMQEPKYQFFKKDQITTVQKNGATIKIICGNWQGHKGPIKDQTPAYFMDIQIPKQGSFQIPIKKGWNSIIFNYKGQVQHFCQNKHHEVKDLECCVFEKSPQKQLVHSIKSKNGASFVLISGQPLNEPVCNKGPFVMNTEEQIKQAFQDYEQCKNGFQFRKDWFPKNKLLKQGKKIEEIWT